METLKLRTAIYRHGVPRVTARADATKAFAANMPKGQWQLNGEQAMAVLLAGLLWSQRQHTISSQLMAVIAPAYRHSDMPYDCESLWAGRYEVLHLYDGRFLAAPGGPIVDIENRREIPPERIANYMVRIEFQIAHLRGRLLANAL